MRLACNAPALLWDEFCAMAAYLTTLTATASLGGKTPFELWFGDAPSLSHLCKIGCKAFALVLTHNLKILQRSVPCVLIGYAPHSKAYQLWNPASGKVFNSYHVNFIEHLDSIPADLLPGTIINIDDQHIFPSWDAATPDMRNSNLNHPPSNFSTTPPTTNSIPVQPPPSIPALPSSAPILPPSNTITPSSSITLPYPVTIPSALILPPSNTICYRR